MYQEDYQPTTGADALAALNTLNSREIPAHDNGSTLNSGEFIDGASKELITTIESTEQTLKNYLFDNDGKVKKRSVNYLSEKGFNAREVVDPDDPYTSAVQIDMPDGEHDLVVETARIP